MSLALLISAAAQAQTTHMKVTVPFEFTAGHVQLPAGEYEVTALGSWGGPTLSLYNVNSKAGSVILSDSCRSLKPTANGKLIFYRYGHEYFLAEVWNRDSFVGSQIKINKRQTELAKNQSKDQVVLVASEK
jgi:hypothetical protein